MKSIENFTNLEIAKLLRKIAAAYTILGENRFKVVAYENAATAVEHSTTEIKDLWDDNRLDTVPGLGPSIISHLEDIFKTGHSKHFNRVLARVNPSVFPLLEIPGLGPKKAEKLVETLKIKDPEKVFDELEKAVKSGQVASIPTFGEKSAQDILEGLERFKRGSIKEKRMVLPQADMIANEIIDYLYQKLGKKVRIDKLGSLRRQVTTIGDVDLAIASYDFESAIEAFVNYPKKVGLVERGPTGASILLASGRQADLRLAKPTEYGAMLQYFTGSKYHNIRLRDFALRRKLSLNEYGIKDLETGKLHVFKDEESFYKFLDLEFVPPELREDAGEIEAALTSQLPKLVKLSDVRGDLQMHSNFDQQTSHDSGIDSIPDLQKAAMVLGYEFIGISNHNPSTSRHSPDQIVAKLNSQKNYIEHLNVSTKSTRILSLLEVDILPTGDLPVSDEALFNLDGCLVSIHSVFNLNREQMTNRVLKGLSHPAARVLAHPTGRLLGEREGFELNWEEIFRFCLKFDKALEINSYPNRLDLPDVLVREAVKRGVLLTLGTDSHRKEDLVNIRYGVSVARRGWAGKKNIINTWPYQKVLKWFHKRG